MFDSVLTKLVKELADLISVVEWQNRLRDTVFPLPGKPSPFDINAAELTVLQAAAPSKLTWRLIDHCASVGRIYAAFELAVIELVEQYSLLAPRVFPLYSGLDEALRTNYRVGVGHVLTKWSSTHSAYGKISENAIAAGLADGLRGSPYVLLPDAFLTDSDNYRPDTLNRVFKKIGFDDAYSAVINNTAVIDFCANRLYGTQTAESYLAKLVKDRNDAAHGNVSQVATVEDLKNYATFVELVASCLAGMLHTRLVKRGIASGVAVEVGNVLHTFSDNVVGVVASGGAMIQLGQKIYAGKKTLEVATVLSLRQGASSINQLQLAAGVQFGLGLDRKVPNGSTIFTSTL